MVSVSSSWRQASRAALAASALLAGLSAAPASAQSMPRQFENAVQLLADSELSTREQASLALREDARITVGMIIDRVKRDALSAEQRFRLLEIAQIKFADPLSRAAMGVQFDPLDDGRGPVIVQTYTAFPSSAVLQVGDRLVEADGQAVGGLDDLRPYIICRDPQDTLPIVIERTGVRMPIDCPLGSFDLFENEQSVRIDPRSLSRAWRERMRIEGLAEDAATKNETIDARMGGAPVFAPPAPAAAAPESVSPPAADTAVSRSTANRTPVAPAGSDALGPSAYGAAIDGYRRRRGETDDAYRARLLSERQGVTEELRKLTAAETQQRESMQLSLTRSAESMRRIREQLDEIRRRLQRAHRLDEELNRLIDSIGADEQ